MKKYYTDSDIGSVLVGTKDFGITVRNGFGDGTTKVFVFDSESEFVKFVNVKDWLFCKTINGTFNIYCYDCSDRCNEDVIATLSGRYAAYCNSGKVAFVKWLD